MILDPSQLLHAALGKLSVRGALHQLCWMCATVGVIFCVFAYLFRDYDHQIVVGLLIVAAMPVLVTLLIAIGFAIFSPSRLQSEDFQIRQHSLQLLQGKDRPTVIDAEAVVALANPSLPEPSAATQIRDGQIQESK